MFIFIFCFVACAPSIKDGRRKESLSIMINKKGRRFCFVVLLADPYEICSTATGSMYCVSTLAWGPWTAAVTSLDSRTGKRKCPACVRFGIPSLWCRYCSTGDNQRKRQPAHFIPHAIVIPARDPQTLILKYRYCALAIILLIRRYHHGFFPSSLRGLFHYG